MVNKLGQVAYEGYKEYSEGKSLVSGAVLPVWTDLPEDIKAAWQLAAIKVYWKVITKGDDDDDI